MARASQVGHFEDEKKKILILYNSFSLLYFELIPSIRYVILSHFLSLSCGKKITEMNFFFKLSWIHLVTYHFDVLAQLVEHFYVLFF